MPAGGAGKASSGVAPFLRKLPVELEAADAGLGDVRLEPEVVRVGSRLADTAAATGRG